jgi:uncharacterized integral membrane protein
MTASPISTISLMLTLAGLVGSFFNIQLSQWLRDLIALEQKAVLNKFQGTEPEKRAIVECSVEYKKLNSTSTYVLNALIIGFVIFVLIDALFMMDQATADPLYPNVATALWVFVVFFLCVSGWLIYAGACTARRAHEAIFGGPKP